MLGRELERDAELLRLPEHEAVGERALGRDLGRALLPVRAEQRGEQHRPVADREPRRERRELLALQVRERRDEIEVPVGDRSRRSVAADARAARRQRAPRPRACASSSSTLHAAISSSVRKQPMHKPVRASIAHTLMHGDGTVALGGGLASRAHAGSGALASSARATRDTGGAAEAVRDELARRARSFVMSTPVSMPSPSQQVERRPRSRRCRSRPSRTDSRRGRRPSSRTSRRPSPAPRRRWSSAWP